MRVLFSKRIFWRNFRDEPTLSPLLENLKLMVVSKLNFRGVQTFRVNPKVDVIAQLARSFKETSTSRFTLRVLNYNY